MAVAARVSVPDGLTSHAQCIQRSVQRVQGHLDLGIKRLPISGRVSKAEVGFGDVADGMSASLAAGSLAEVRGGSRQFADCTRGLLRCAQDAEPGVPIAIHHAIMDVTRIVVSFRFFDGWGEADARGSKSLGSERQVFPSREEVLHKPVGRLVPQQEREERVALREPVASLATGFA